MSVNPEEEQAAALEKEAKRLRLRSRSVEELVKTEIQYVHDLEVLTEVYIVPLKPLNKSKDIINMEQHRLLFNNIPALIQLNKQFKSGLELRYQNWDNATSKIADEFLQFAPFFHMYQGYLNSHEQAAGLVSKLYIRSSKFKKFVDSAQFNPKCNGLDLKSYLVKPLQRITKYTLLLRELIKHTLSDHPDYDGLQLAMIKINEVNVTINEKMKTFDQRQKVRDIEARFTTNIDLVAPARYFIKEGKLTKICRKKDIQYIFVLFSDLLIYGEKVSDNQIKIHQQIPINTSFKIRDIPQNIKYGAKCWEIHSPEKSFIVYADHPGLKHEWFREMEKVVKLRSTIESGKNRVAALWVPDDFSKECMMPTCKNKFSSFNRRHHCRYCGRLVCGPCSTNKLPHWDRTKKSKKVVRVCTVCWDENKELQNYKGNKLERFNSEKQRGTADDVDIKDDDDSMSAGSEIDFEYWDSDEIIDDSAIIQQNGGMHLDGDESSNIPDNPSLNGGYSDIQQNGGSRGGGDNEKKTPTEDTQQPQTVNSSKFKRKSGKGGRKSRKQRGKRTGIHHRSASMGAEVDANERQNSNRGIFSNTAKIFRLVYQEHVPKKSTRILHELAELSLPKRPSMRPTSSVDGAKRESEDFSQSINNYNGYSSDGMSSKPNSAGATIPNFASQEDAISNPLSSPEMKTMNSASHLDDSEDEKKSNDHMHHTKTSTNFSSVSGVLAPLILTNSISVGGSGLTMSGASTPRSAANKRFKIVGTGMLNIEAHQYDHELVSMRLATFTEVIDWNLDPHSMKPKRKDDFSCYLKALNVLTQTNEILLIRIKNKNIMDSLVTILLSLSYYYEAENENRDDDDLDSDCTESEDQNGKSVTTVRLNADNTLEEHKAAIDRAVFLIENSKKHNNIKTIDVAKFLLAKSCPISVIQHAFGKAGVVMPDEVYELAGVPNPKHRKKKYREKDMKIKKGKQAHKASKLFGTGMNRQSIAQKKANKRRERMRANSQDFGDLGKYEKKYKNGESNGRKSGLKLFLKQSQSEAAKDPDDDWWLPSDVILPDADHDNRYQDALFQHDVRFSLMNKVYKDTSKTLPSDVLDANIRITINLMSDFSVKGTSPISPSYSHKDGGPSFNTLSAKHVSKGNRKSKKFSIFGSKN